MKILVTGAAGFIGANIVNKLVDRGDEVIGLDNINDYYEIKLKYARLEIEGIFHDQIQYNTLIKSSTRNNYKFIKLNLEDKKNIDTLFENENFTAVCHIAAQAGVRYSLLNPDAYVQSNIIGFMNILEGCRQNNINELTFASSSSVYGLNEEVPFKTTDNVDHPISLYAATKKSNELMAHAYSHLYKIRTTGLRFFTVYGPWGRPDMAPILFTRAALENKPIDVFNHGKMFRDFTYIDDIVDGVIKVIDNPASENLDWSGKNPDPSSSSAPYKIYNIGNSSPVKLMDFIDAIEKKLGITIEKNMMPIQPGDVQGTYADVSGLTKDFDYHPNTTIEEGIGKFIDWYLQYYKK